MMGEKLEGWGSKTRGQLGPAVGAQPLKTQKAPDVDKNEARRGLTAGKGLTLDAIKTGALTVDPRRASKRMPAINRSELRQPIQKP